MGALFGADDPQLQYDADRYRHRENKGRRAGVYKSYDTTGQGVVEFPARINFGLTYIEEPWVSYGAKIDMDSVRDVLAIDGDGDVAWLPSSMGYVTEWDRNDKGHYIGAWVAVGVNYPAGIPVDAQISIHHYFSFEAIALKDIPLPEGEL